MWDNYRTPQIKDQSPFKLFIAVIAAIVIGGIFLWFARIALIGMFLDGMLKTGTKELQNLQTQSLQNQARIQSQQQAQAQFARNQKELQNLQTQFLQNQARNQYINSLTPNQREALRRNELWKQQYSPPPQCLNVTNGYILNECMKYEKTARTNFDNTQNGKEKYWNRFYTPPEKCLNPESALRELECNNESRNMRIRFERDWQAKINTGWIPRQLN